MSSYASIKAIREWTAKPHRFSEAERHVLAPYFESDEFYDQGWDLYFWETSYSDFMLVPVSQAKQFMKWVADETGMERLLAVTEKDLSFSIEQHSAHAAPRLIGTAASRQQFESLVEQHGWKEGEKDNRRKADKARKKRRKQERHALAMKGYIARVRLARQCLGLGNRACAANEQAADRVAFDREKPVFVSVDVEAWEVNHRNVTEIGIAILDTAKIPPVDQLPPFSMADVDLDAWDHENTINTRSTAICKLIECRHLRILEHKSMRNGQFVSDASDLFQFGQSEWVNLKDVPAILGSAFRFNDEHGNRRKVILVGHDVEQDFAYLRVTGYDVQNLKDVDVIDTTALYKAFKGVHESRGLSAVLTSMGIIYFHLHNAGNDAAYTLQALVHMADRGITAEQEEAGEAAAAEFGNVADGDDVANNGESSPDGEEPIKKSRARRRNRGRARRPSPAPPVPQPKFLIGWD